MGAFCADADEARVLHDLGVNFLTPGNDIGLIKSAAADVIERLNKGVKDKNHVPVVAGH